MSGNQNPPRRPSGGSQRRPGKARTGTRVTPGTGRGKSPTKRPWTLRRLVRLAFVTGLVLVLVIALGLIAGYNLTTVPSANKAFQTQTTKVFYDGGKTELGSFVDQNRESIPYAEIPKNVRDAAVAAEDRTFWSNRGIDPKGILRAAFSNASGKSTQGASTITQQYVKILYLTSERTFKRKFKEAFVSLKLQRQQTKRQILAGYLNTIYFGRGAYGIQAAAETYFRKDAKSLTVPEGAFLAAVLNSPENLDPANGAAAKRAVTERYRYVLSGMVDMGTLTADKGDTYEAKLPTLPKERKTQKYGAQRGFMLEMIHDELRRLGFSDAEINGGGLRVTSTFSRSAMKATRSGVLSQKPPGLKQLHVGAVSLDVKTGGLRGIYGGQDYLKSSFNWALKGAQPGSSFKPFALAAGIKDGFSLKDTFDGNSPYTFPDGSTVQNEGSGSGNDYGSAINLIKATEESVNTAFIDLTASMDQGPKKIVAMAKSLGIPVAQDQIQANSGVSLGSERVGAIDMANAYAAIADGGKAHPWYVVEKVTRANGEVAYQNKHQTKRALDPDIAADVSYALQDVVKYGTGTTVQSIDRPAAGKTGTATNDKGDVSSAWFVGFTPQIATAVMYVRGDGNDALDGYLPSYFGAAYPARTWAAIMGAELKGAPVVDFPPPVYVDGTPPSSGHAPYVAPTYTAPAPTQAPPKRPRKSRPAPQPSSTPSAQPSADTDRGPVKRSARSIRPRPTRTPKPTKTPKPPRNNAGG